MSRISTVGALAVGLLTPALVAADEPRELAPGFELDGTEVEVTFLGSEAAAYYDANIRVERKSEGQWIEVPGMWMQSDQLTYEGETLHELSRMVPCADSGTQTLRLIRGEQEWERDTVDCVVPTYGCNTTGIAGGAAGLLLLAIALGARRRHS